MQRQLDYPDIWAADYGPNLVWSLEQLPAVRIYSRDNCGPDDPFHCASFYAVPKPRNLLGWLRGSTTLTFRGTTNHLSLLNGRIAFVNIMGSREFDRIGSPV